jgi:hypothetical protein
VETAKVSNKLSLQGYQLPPDLKSIAERTAHFLFWAAEHYPYVFIPITFVAQAIFAFSTPRRNGSPEANTASNSCSRAGELLRSRFGREIVRKPGLGVRATVDELDKTKTVVPPAVRKNERTAKKLAAIVDNIDTKQIPKTAMTRPWVRWLEVEIRPSIKEIVSTHLKMLPPYTHAALKKPGGS